MNNTIYLNNFFKYYTIILTIALLSSGCVSKLSPKVRQQTADTVAQAGNLVQQKIATDDFLLTTYQRFDATSDNKQMVVYIEGDGMAWISRDQLSSNPTPVQPVALKLASIDTNINVLYVARPCQYLWPQKMNRCSSKYWSNKRSSEEVISSINQAISIVKQKQNISSIRLIGYSGGGGIAALIADRRADVNEFVSVSGNLNYKLFTQTHDLSPMNGSIDPITVANQIGSIPQIHYVGADDKIIPKQIALSFSDKVKVISDVSHDNWPDKWAQILRTINHDLSP
jgi:hypothetical protein